MPGRSVRQILGGDGDYLGGAAARDAAAQGTPPNGQIGTIPLGAYTGAPPRASFRTAQVVPFSFVQQVSQGISSQATKIVDGERASRSILLTAPFVGFSIFIAEDPTVRPGTGLRLPPGLPYPLELPGGQALYAVTDAPVYLSLSVQVTPLMVGDRERMQG
jgi:hypothetical protein